MSIVGTLIGLAAYPTMSQVHQRANPALGAFGFLVNAITVLAVLGLISLLLRRATSEGARATSRHREILQMARIATLIFVLQLAYGFIAGEARLFVLVYVGNRTQLDLLTATWAVVLGVVVPGVLLVVLFLVTQASGGPKSVASA